VWLTVSGTMSRGGAVVGTGAYCGPWIGWRQNRTFIFEALEPVLKLSIRLGVRAPECFQQA